MKNWFLLRFIFFKLISRNHRNHTQIIIRSFFVPFILSFQKETRWKRTGNETQSIKYHCIENHYHLCDFPKRIRQILVTGFVFYYFVITMTRIFHPSCIWCYYFVLYVFQICIYLCTVIMKQNKYSHQHQHRVLFT